MRGILLIAWIAVRELVYEKVSYVLVVFAIGTLGLSFMLGKLTYTEEAKITVDFMLAGIEGSLILFSIFMSISLFHRELSWGSVAMILSKPIERHTFLLGKYLGQIAIQSVVGAMMGLLTIGFAWLTFSPQYMVAITQCLLTILLEGTVLTAMTYALAVNAGALVTSMVAVCLFALGHLHSTLDKLLGEGLARSVWGAIRLFIPNLEIFNLKSLASYGHTLEWSILGWIGLYGLVCVMFILTIAIITFERKDITT